MTRASQLTQSQILRSCQKFGLCADRIPRHVAIIMDGNGRWASRRGLPRGAGHREGSKSVRSVSQLARELGVEYLTLYCLSSENWKRPQSELDDLLGLLIKFLKSEREHMLKNEIRLQVIGRRAGMPSQVLDSLDEAVALTASNTGMTLCLAINYGSRAEIADTVRQIAWEIREGQLDPDQIDETLIGGRLQTGGQPDPDLLIRTAGEMRLSNYLLWQISYAELWVTQKLWPEFRDADLVEAFRDYASRRRNFGALRMEPIATTASPEQNGSTRVQRADSADHLDLPTNATLNLDEADAPLEPAFSSIPQTSELGWPR